MHSMDRSSRSVSRAQWQSNWGTIAEPLPPKSIFEEGSIFMSEQPSHPLDETQAALTPPVEQESPFQAALERDVEERLRRINRRSVQKPARSQIVMALSIAAMVVLVVGGIILSHLPI